MLLFISTIIWGVGYISVKTAINAGYQPFFISSVRFTIATLILMIHQRKNFAHTTRKTYHSGIVLGIFLFLGFTVQTIALQYTTVSKNSFITSIYVVFVPFIFWLIYRRRPSTIQFIAVFISLLGTRFLTSDIEGKMNIGDVMALCGALFFAVHIVMLGIYAKNHNPVILTCLQSAVAGIASGILFLTFEPFPSFNLQENMQGILAILYLGTFSSCLGFALQSVAQKYVSQITASLILSLEAVFATVFSILLLKEKIHLSFVIGGILIFFAILLAEIKLKVPKNRKPVLPKIELDAGD